MYRCLHPRNITTSNKEGTEKWIIDNVPCGHCTNCLANKRDEWCVRLKEEVKGSLTAWCVTLTYDDDHLPFDKHYRLPVLRKEDPQKWIRALRDFYGHDLPIRYFIVGEYGSKSLRPHYHAMVFNLPWNYYQQATDMSLKFWPHCLVDGLHVDLVDEATIRYCSKYCLKRYDYGDDLPYMRPLMSKGIGRSYLTPDRVEFHRRSLRNYIIQDGFKAGLPRYYKDKLFDSDMKEQIAEQSQFLISLRESKDSDKDLKVQGWTLRRDPVQLLSHGGVFYHVYKSSVYLSSFDERADIKGFMQNPQYLRDYRMEIARHQAEKHEKVKHFNNSI